jgi:hypothetical protein
MKYLLISALMLLGGCVTKVEYVPLYLEVQPQQPSPPNVEPLKWLYVDKYFALTAEEFDKYINNLKELDTYIAKLQNGWTYYYDATKPRE